MGSIAPQMGSIAPPKQQRMGELWYGYMVTHPPFFVAFCCYCGRGMALFQLKLEMWGWIFLDKDIPSLKLTARTWKYMNLVQMKFPFGVAFRPIFRWRIYIYIPTLIVLKWFELRKLGVDQEHTPKRRSQVKQILYKGGNISPYNHLLTWEHVGIIFMLKCLPKVLDKLVLFCFSLYSLHAEILSLHSLQYNLEAPKNIPAPNSTQHCFSKKA